MEEAAEKIKEATEAVFEDLENQTGTTPSSSGEHCLVIEDCDFEGQIMSTCSSRDIKKKMVI